MIFISKAMYSTYILCTLCRPTNNTGWWEYTW